MFRTLTQVPLEGERLAELPEPEPAERELPEPDPVDPVWPVPVRPTDPVPEPVEPEPAEPPPPVPVPPALVPEPEPPACPVPPPVPVPEPEPPPVPVPPPVLVPEPEPPVCPVPPPVPVPEPELPACPVPPPVLVPEPELPVCPVVPLPVPPLPVPPDPAGPDEPAKPVVTAGPGADGPDPLEAAVPEAADDPAVQAPCVLVGSPWDPAADVPGDTSCRAARCPGRRVRPRDEPPWPCDGTAGAATGTDRPGTGVTPPTTASWLDDRGADGRTWIDTVAIMTKMTAAAEKKNTGSVLPAG